MIKLFFTTIFVSIVNFANAQWQPSTIKSNNTKDTILSIDSNKQPNPLNQPLARILNHNSPTFYIGAGFASPSATVIENAYCTNLIGFKINMFLPGPTARIVKNFSYGFNIGNEYFYSNQYQFNNLPAPYNIVGQKAPPAIVSNNPKLTGFKFEAGLQFNILFAKRFVISPILNMGSFYIEQQSCIFQQATTMNSGNSGIKRYNLLTTQMQTVYPPLHLFGVTSSDDDGRASFFSPKLRLHYYFSNWVALWAEANYVLGPNVYYNNTEFYPQGFPDQNGEYTLSQMDAGKYFIKTTTIRYSTFGLNFGMAITIPTQQQIKIVKKTQASYNGFKKQY